MLDKFINFFICCNVFAICVCASDVDGDGDEKKRKEKRKIEIRKINGGKMLAH